jgi:S1-C subfamily serine protease
MSSNRRSNLVDFMGKGPHMHNTYLKQISFPRPTWSRRMLLAISLICLTLLTMAGTTRTSYADGIPGGNVSDPVVRAVDIARPAVVRMITSLGGHLTVHFQANQGTQNVTFPQNDPNGYLIQLSGSGTFISTGGDILTADHVVNPPHDQTLSDYLDQLATPDVTTYLNQHSTTQYSQDQVTRLLQSGSLPSDANYDQPSSEVFLSTDYTGPLSATNFSQIPSQIHATVDRIEQQSSFNQKDVAIVHVAMNDMASVQLGDSSTVQPQDALTIIGFPGNGDVSNRPTDLLTSSVNKITVSSIKTTDSGAPVIQVGGNVEHGDSGGPALDSQGTVVGIVSFGSSGPGSTSFLQASNSARDLVKSLKLDTTPGPFQAAWKQAFTDYASNTPGHWHKAYQEFTQIANKYPLFKAITPYLNYAQNQANTEQTTQSSSQQTNSTSAAILLWTVGGVGLAALIALALFAATLRGRRRAAPSGVSGRPIEASVPPVVTQENQNRFIPPPQSVSVPVDDDGFSAFGAPPRTPRVSQAVPPIATAPTSAGVTSNTLVSWPCGHMNRSNARYCSVCGEPTHVEQ